jgi:hypothetical protein
MIAMEVGGPDPLDRQRHRDDGAPAPRINARSNVVANASRVLEFDPIARSADYIVRAAAGHAKMT